MTLEPTAVHVTEIIDEWAGAHDVLTRLGVPTGSTDADPPVVWSLPSRIMWLSDQPKHAERVVAELRNSLHGYDIRRGLVR